MSGYITEKIFDCIYAGTIPLYLGAKNIEALIPPGVYLDCRHFKSWEDMCNKVIAMSASEIDAMREAGRSFVQSEAGLKYYNSLVNIFSASSAQ